MQLGVMLICFLSQRIQLKYVLMVIEQSLLSAPSGHLATVHQLTRNPLVESPSLLKSLMTTPPCHSAPSPAVDPGLVRSMVTRTNATEDICITGLSRWGRILGMPFANQVPTEFP